MVGRSVSKPEGENEAREYDVFLSYSRADLEVADRIYQALSDKHIKVWQDRKETAFGKPFPSQIENGMSHSRVYAVLVSPRSLDSHWVEKERNLAIILHKERPDSFTIIPLLYDGVTTPGFLKTYPWIDFGREEGFEARFEENIEKLVQAVRTGIESADGRDVTFPEELLFLVAFPEGLMKPIYDSVVHQMQVQQAADSAIQKGILYLDDGCRPPLVCFAGDLVRQHYAKIYVDRDIPSRLILALKDCIETNDPFQFLEHLGKGQLLLLRDLAVLAESLWIQGASDEKTENACRWAFERAREGLTGAMGAEELCLAIEISASLLRSCPDVVIQDRMLHARLLMRIGANRAAISWFDLDDAAELFPDLPTDDDLQRFKAALDWAVACKNSGQGRSRHKEIMRIYEHMLSGIDKLIDVEPRDDFLQVKAQVLNNRATQIAIFGDESQWTEADASLKAAVGIFALLKNTEGILRSRLNFVALSLDHKPDAAVLDEVRDSLEDLDHLLENYRPSPDQAFFYCYQKARLLKYERKITGPDEAIQAYARARDVAASDGLSAKAAIAERWVQKLRRESSTISEIEYLKNMGKCANQLREARQDAWAARSLRDCLTELAQVHKLRNESRDAWMALAEAFEVEAQLVGMSGSQRLLSILSEMSALSSSDDLRSSFLRSNGSLIRKIIGIAQWDTLDWYHVENRVKGSNNGNAIH